METLADRLKALMKGQGIENGRELARRAGLKSETHVGLILRGTVKRPAAATLAPIASVLKTTVEFLLDGGLLKFEDATSDPTDLRDLRGTARRRFLEDAGARSDAEREAAETFLEEVQLHAAKGAEGWTAADFQHELEQLFRAWKRSRATLSDRPAAIYGTGVRALEVEAEEHDDRLMDTAERKVAERKSAAMTTDAPPPAKRKVPPEEPTAVRRRPPPSHRSPKAPAPGRKKARSR